MHRDLYRAAGSAFSGNVHPPRSAPRHALGRASVFYRATALSSVLAAGPLAVLWFLTGASARPHGCSLRRFYGADFIATALALPFNTAFFALVDLWVAQHPIVSVVLGPDAAIMLAAPISAPIAEEITKALGVLLIFWLLRAEFDNLRDGIVYGALVGWLRATPRMEWCHMAPSSGADTRS